METNLIFVNGKGGVGKTAVSRALALRLAQSKRRVLWVTFEDPAFPARLSRVNANLSHLNIELMQAFDEYAELKLGSAKVAAFFSQSKLMRFLAQAAPGFRDLVLIGKAWQIRNEYDHLVLDMPATGHSLTMFQSTMNFRKAFGVGPLAQDSDRMLETFADPAQCASIILALPEETPLIEGRELGEKLKGYFPKIEPRYWINRVWPTSPGAASANHVPLVPRTAEEFLACKTSEEAKNVGLWKDQGIPFAVLPRLAPPPAGTAAPVILELAERLVEHLPAESMS